MTGLRVTGTRTGSASSFPYLSSVLRVTDANGRVAVRGWGRVLGKTGQTRAADAGEGQVPPESAEVRAGGPARAPRAPSDDVPRERTREARAQGQRLSSPHTRPRRASRDKPEAAKRDEERAHGSGSEPSILSPSACLSFPAQPTGRNLTAPT